MHNLELIYGKYRVPERIRKLFQLEAELQEEGLSLENVWMRLEKSNFRYFITPPDLITFISTGGDGIHFGFLTDFGQVEDLEEAYIVCVSPTNDPPLKIVARNLHEFLRLAYTLKLAESLDNMHCFTSEEDFLRDLKEFTEEVFEGKFRSKAEATMEKLGEKFQLKPVDSVFSYINSVRSERAQLLAINTLDGIGVIKRGKELAARRYDFKRPKNIADMREFLQKSSWEEKLGFFRDAHYAYILVDTYDIDVKDLVLEEMNKMDLKDEVRRMTLPAF